MVRPSDLQRLRDVAHELLGESVERLARLAHPRGGWSDFWLEPGSSTSWVTAYAASALADAATVQTITVGERALAAGLVQSAADRLLAAERDGSWGWAEGMRPDADSTAWAVRALLAGGRSVPERSWAFLDRHLGPDGASTYIDSATGTWAQAMPEVTAVVLEALEAGDLLAAGELTRQWDQLLVPPPDPQLVSEAGLEAHLAQQLPGGGGAGEFVWSSQWWPGAAHPTAVVLDALIRSGRWSDLAHAEGVRLRAHLGEARSPGNAAPVVPQPRSPEEEVARNGELEAHLAHESPMLAAPAGPFDRAASDPSSACELADVLWVHALLGRPDAALAEALLSRRLPGGGWAGDAVVLVPAQNGGRPPIRTSDARGVFTTATVLHAAVALLRALTEAHPTRDENVLLPDRDTWSGRGDADRRGAASVSSDQTAEAWAAGQPLATKVPDAAGVAPGGPGADMLPQPRPATEATSTRPRDERWDAVIARAADAQSVAPETALRVFRSLTRDSLAAGAPWPSPQLSSLASGAPVELSASTAPGLRFTCEVGDPRLSPPDRVRAGLHAVDRTAALLQLSEAWSGRHAQLLGVLANPGLPVPEGCRFWLWAGVDLPTAGEPVLKAYLSLHAGDVDDWRARLHAALRFLPSAGTVWSALACLRGAGWCHEVGLGEMPGDRWGLKVYYELDRWRPDLVSELLTTCGLSAELTELTADIPGVVRAAHRGRRRAGIALRVDPTTGDVVELTTTLALPPPMVGRAVLADRVAVWLESRGQDTSPLRATLAAVEPEWADAGPAERMLSLVTLSAGRRSPSATVYVRPRPTAASS